MDLNQDVIVYNIGKPGPIQLALRLRQVAQAQELEH